MQHSYVVLAARLQAAIRSGQYPVGERLPSVRELAAAYAVSVSTATRCYRQLEREGYADARYKSGMYVADWKALRQARQALPAPAALHLASAAPEWYPCDALARLAQRQLRHHPRALGAYPSGTGLLPHRPRPQAS